MKQRKSEKGFTIIELVVVILLLGILTATALPRFMDVTSQAHDAVVQGVVGGMATGVALSRATWFAEGRSATGISGFGDGFVAVNTSGYPTGVQGGPPSGAAACITAYEEILQPGGRPTTRVYNGTGTVAGNWLGAADAANLTYDADFEVAHSANTCWYIYTAEGATASSPFIVYDTSTGALALSSGEI